MMGADAIRCRPRIGDTGMGGRIWRLYVTKNINNNLSCDISEIEFRSVIGGASESVGGVATASSSYAANPPGNAFDGITGSASRWVAAAKNPQWIAYEHTASVEVAEVVIVVGDGVRGPADLEIQYSDDDGTTWTTVKSVVGLPYTGSYKTKVIQL